MYYLLFAFYLAAACFLINRIPFIRNCGLGTGLISILFLVKVIAGIFIGWMSQKFYPQGNDYWNLHAAGLEANDALVTSPGQFFTDIFSLPGQHGYGGLFESEASFWVDLKNALIIKILAICNIFSRGSYYINSIFFNILGFMGHVALYRVFRDIYPGKLWPLVAGCFLLPSTLYFTSGIHKDLVVFAMLGIYVFALYYSLQKEFSLKYVTALVISFSLLFFMRNFVAFAIIPASLALYIATRRKWNVMAVFAAVYLFLFSIVFAANQLSPSFNPLEVISNKQQDFAKLPKATSQLEIPMLEPTLSSFTRHAPGALERGLLQPHVWETATAFLIPLAIEVVVYLALFLLMLLIPYSWKINNTVVFGIVLAISMILITGYIVPNAGSIVRYRAIYLPLLLVPVLCNINFKKLKRKKHIA